MIFINGHQVVLDEDERLEPWTPYDRVVWLAMDFIKRCPVEPRNGLPWYLQYSCFWTDPLRPTVWPDNPAGKFAWAVTTLLAYYPYSGDSAFIDIVRTMLDRLIEQHTPTHYAWGGIPYASAHPGTGVYFGARADGEYATESDKVAQAARAYVDFYEMTGETRYLDAGRHCADVLVDKMRAGDAAHSPWPFRVDVRDDTIIEEYTSDVIQMVRLFGELIRLGDTHYRAPCDAAWQWLCDFPLQNNIWKGYFEDIRLDPANANRDQLAPLETARYLLDHPERDPAWRKAVPRLIEWVRCELGASPFFTAVPIHEQKFCYHVMGSHTARYASLCARWAAVSGDATYAERARRSLNWATYMANEDGTVHVGTDLPDYYNQCWFTDGYFDFVPHLIECMAALPELAPHDSDHLLKSSSVVQEIRYKPYHIRYRVFDETGSQLLKLTFEPRQVLCDDKPLPRVQEQTNGPAWSFDRASRVLRIGHAGRQVEIRG